MRDMFRPMMCVYSDSGLFIIFLFMIAWATVIVVFMNKCSEEPSKSGGGEKIRKTFSKFLMVSIGLDDSHHV